MSSIDLAIIGIVVLSIVMGLRSGFLGLVSGIGGLVVGVILALQYQGQVAPAFAEYIDNETIRRLAAFAAIVISTVIGFRLTAYLGRELLRIVGLGWLDHVAGAVSAGAFAVAALGTLAFVAEGADIPAARETFRTSTLVTPISRASLLSTSSPWCSELKQLSSNLPISSGLETGAVPASPAIIEECTDLSSLAKRLFGGPISDALSGLVGHDVETLVGLVEEGLSALPAQLTNTV